MRDYSKGRSGFDRVLMAVAATFLTVSAGAAFAAQTTSPRDSVSELAIDAAVPRPEPANVPPPTAGDFKTETTASVSDDIKATEKAATERPVVIPAADAPVKKDDAATAPVTVPGIEPAKEPTKEMTKEIAKPATSVAAADQPVADKLRDMIGAKSSKYFDRRGERAAVDKFYSARDYAPLWTQGGTLTTAANGVIAGVPFSRLDPAAGLDDVLLVAITETTPDSDILLFSKALTKVLAQ